jgi:hypothetical protein
MYAAIIKDVTNAIVHPVRLRLPHLNEGKVLGTVRCQQLSPQKKGRHV